MITGRRHRTHAVTPRRQASFHGSRKTSLSVTRIIDTLEEHELGCVRRGGRRKIVAEGLDGDVDVADDLAPLERLRSGVICGIGIGERAGLEIGYFDVDVEVVICRNVVAWRRVCDDGGYHVCGRGNVSHDCLIVSSSGIIEETGGRITYLYHYMIPL